MRSKHISITIPVDLKALLAEGYREMADEALKITRDFETLDQKTFKRVEKNK